MISFLSENIAAPDIDQEIVRNWIAHTAESYGKKLGDISYIFCDDKRILEVNRQFLGHDYYTDIITFDYTHRDTISGDLFISIDTVSSNAALLNVDYAQELLRVIIHGILHLCGINDKGPGEREIMEAAENRALQTIRAWQS